MTIILWQLYNNIVSKIVCIIIMKNIIYYATLNEMFKQCIR